MLASLEYAKPLQIDIELAQLIELLKIERVESYLEIGARYGGSFEMIVSALCPCLGVAVDLPGGNFGDEKSAPILLAAAKRLENGGNDARVIFGRSDSQAVVDKVKAIGPYDAVMIDGDHAYEAAKQDFELYAGMGNIVILHDIAAPDDVRSRTGKPVEVPRLWNELKPLYRHTEIAGPDSNMGIGVLWMKGK